MKNSICIQYAERLAKISFIQGIENGFDSFRFVENC